MSFVSNTVQRSWATCSPWHKNSLGYYMPEDAATTPTSAVWPTANRAIYVPFTLDVGVLVTQMFTHNGAAAADNIDIGIFNSAGTKLVSSGSTAQSGTNTLQIFDVTDTPIGPGYFFMGLAMDGTTGTIFRAAPGSHVLASYGIKTETSAFALPATATFSNAAVAYLPYFGWSTVAI